MDDIRKQKMFAFKNFLQPGDLVFDVGANIGNETKKYLDYNTRVVAFEANPELAAKLCLKFINDNNVFIENKAMADRPGLVTLNICTKIDTISTCSPQWFLGRFHGNVWDKKVNVPSITLDMAIAFFGSPRFIKIDVEGFELQVISGLSRAVDCLSFEFTIEFYENMVYCMKHLESIGLNRFNICLGEHASLALPKWVSRKALEEIVVNLGKKTKDLWGDVYATQS